MSNAPTAERGEHGGLLQPQIDPAHFAPFWRACDRIDKLLRDGSITPREYRAAVAFRITYEAAFRGTLRGQDWNFTRTDKYCRRPGLSMSEGQARSLARLRHLRASLGDLFVLLELVLVEELSFRDLGRRLGVCHPTARSWAVGALAALADRREHSA